FEGIGLSDDGCREGEVQGPGTRVVREVPQDGHRPTRRSRRYGVPGQARGPLRGVRIPGSREVREPRVAHARGRDPGEEGDRVAGVRMTAPDVAATDGRDKAGGPVRVQLRCRDAIV